MPKTTPADIAAQVMELSDTQVLVLHLPEGLATSDDAFKNFAADLRATLGEEMAGCIRCIVLRHDMDIEALDAAQLERVGLHRTPVIPGKTPELLFDSGPLRQAARAGWESAKGRRKQAEVCAQTARAALEQEFKMRDKLDVRTS